ncbi:MAG: hypothetical protein N4A38_04140 [Candidatus Gracilibacteria bacterium]|nr:hypothetical protein [Candidatus Gracilibacteria bacterium]
MNETKEVKTKKSGLTLSVIFFILVLVVTAGINFYSNKIEQENNKTQAKIDEVVASINNIKKDEKTQIFELIERNKKALDRKAILSDIPNFVGVMKQMSDTYNVDFEGFNYSKGIVTSQSKAITNNESLAYEKVAKFIKEYRADEESLFNILFIDALEGTNQIKFNVELEVK